MKLRLAFAASLLVVGLPLRAQAQQTMQPWLADRRYGEGIGVRTGNVEVHPGVAAEVGYDSNYFLRAPGEDGGVVSAYRLRITPSLSLATLGPERRGGVNAGPPPPLKFRTGVFASYNELFGNDQVSKQRNVDLGATLRLDVFPQGRVGVDAYADYLRVIQPSNDADTENAFNRDSMRVGAGATWRPGGGLFSWRLGYELAYHYFEEARFRIYDNFQHTASMRGRWRFLPRTAFLYEGQYTWVQYTSGAAQANGNLLRTRIGLNGLVTNRFGLLGMIGWGASFYDSKGGVPARQYDSLTAQAEVRWFLTAQEKLEPTSAPVGLSSVAAGYQRDFANSYLGNFYQKDRGYVGFSYMLGGVLIVDVQGGLSNIAFPTTYFPDGNQRNAAFSQQRIDAQLFSEYRFSDTWGVNTTVRYDQNISDTKLNVSETVPPVQDDLRFKRWQAFLGVRWFM